MRFSGWFFLVLGVACLVAAGAFGILAIQQAAEMSAYQHARACRAGAPSHADCLRIVDGSVTAVTESPGGSGISADYALDVRTTSAKLHVTFSSASPMLGYAVDGEPAVVTMWRGVPVSVATDGRSEVTASVPETALARDLGDSEETGGVGVFFVVAVAASRGDRRVGGRHALRRAVLAAALLALTLGGIVLAFSGMALGGKPSRLGPDLAATSAALVVVLGLSAWLGMRVRRRASGSLANRAGTPGIAAGARDLPAPMLHAAPPGRMTRTPLRIRMRPANWARAAGAGAAAYLPVLLTVAVLSGVFLTTNDGPTARAFRHAPACVGETNVAVCVGDFTAVINGVRAPADGANGADVSYVTADGAINTWASFGGNSATVVRMASADEKARTPLRIRVWRRSIIGAELGGSWHWAFGEPPGNTVPAVFLAVSFALLIFVVRLRIHLRARRTASSRRLLPGDLGQAGAAAGSIVLLEYGLWPGAILALAALLWLGLSARRNIA